MFLQIARSISAEAWTALAAVAGLATFLGKKLILKKKPKPDPITRSEFHHHLDAMRDRIGASYLALAEKIDHNHNQVLAALENQRSDFEHRLDRLDTAVARLDERTTIR